MKIKNLLLAGLFVLGMTACTNNDEPEINGGSGLKGYITLDIKGHLNQLKTQGGPNDDEHKIDAESAIENVTLAFVNKATGVVEFTTTKTLTSGSTGAFEIQEGKYQVYALVNNASSIVGGSNIRQVITVAAAADADKGFKNGKFFMTNALHNAAAEVEETTVSSTANNTPEKAAPVTIKVDRVAARIYDKTVATDIDITALTAKHSFITAVEVPGFVVLNTNKQFNLLQTWSEKNDDGAALSQKVLSTPMYTADWENNFFHPMSEYTKWVNNATGEVESITDLTKEEDYKKGPVYTTENRPAIRFFNENKKPTSGKAETTGVIYRVQVTPKSTFYEYKGLVYKSLDDLKKIDAFKDMTDFPTEVSAQRALGIRVYTNGVMYYTEYIKDVNQNEAEYYLTLGGVKENYYSVFRNSSYRLNIKSIKDLGDDVPGGGIDPKDPNPEIDIDKSYINVTVEVNPWVLNEIGIDF